MESISTEEFYAQNVPLAYTINIKQPQLYCQIHFVYDD